MEVIATDEFCAWYDGLSDADEGAVYRYVELLEARGVGLDHPYSSKVKGSKHSGMRELRIQSGGRPIRVFYVFSEEQNAVLLIGGEKTGNDRFYDEYIPVADRIYDDYINERKPVLAAKKAPVGDMKPMPKK